ncbi:MAG: hypothetical protein H7257_10495 [Taibaiella sp.]|nr:hypothetical protein [Taibaiella sp.]
MKLFFLAFFLVVNSTISFSQSTFKCGWTTFKTSTLVHEYTYSYTLQDSVKFFLADSVKYFIAPDSQAILKVEYPFHDKITYKTASYLNDKKKVTKCEEYKDNLVTGVKDYKYDDKGRVIYELDENKVINRTYKKTFEYVTEKNGEQVIKEVSYFNGALEFYTRSYFNKNNQKYKEIRLNDNNKDIVHEEKFIYNAAGKLKSRSVYFPEWKVTKNFPEAGGDDPDKCFKTNPVNISDKPSAATKIGFMRKLLTKNKSILLDPDCHEFSYRFYNSDCEVIVSTTKINNIKQVIFRFKERMHY